MYNQINMTTYSVDVIDTKVNAICREFVTSLYKDIDELVAEFDENDPNCWFWSDPNYLWFDRHRLRQLLTYIKEHSLSNFTVHLYKTWDGGRSSSFDAMSLDAPKKQNENDLAIHVIKPVVKSSSGYWLEPEIRSFSGGQYVNTRADIKLTNN